MEGFTKLGSLDFDVTLDSPTEYKNDLFSSQSSTTDSDYGSLVQLTPSSSFDRSNEFDSMSSEYSSSSQHNNCEDDSSLPGDIINNISVSHRPIQCSEGSERCCKRKTTHGHYQMNCTGYTGSEGIEDNTYSPTKLMKNGPMAGGTCFPKIHRNESCDIIEDKAISFDEMDAANMLREMEQPRSTMYYNRTRPKKQKRKNTQDDDTATKQVCHCNSHPVLRTSHLHNESDWVLLESRLNGHFLGESSPEFQNRFRIKNRDRLLRVNGDKLHHLDHVQVFAKLQEFLRMERRHSLTIERHSHTEQEDVIIFTEIEIQFDFIEEDGANTVASFTARIIRKLVRPFSIIYNLEWRGKDKCWISHYTAGHQMYLCVREDRPEQLTLANLPSTDDPRFQFSQDVYHGFRREDGSNNELYLMTIMSKATDGYISIGSAGNVKLKSCDDDIKHMTSIQRPISRMFICRERNGKYNIESLNHKGCFLRWNTQKGMMDIKELDDDTMYQTWNQPEFLFSIYTRVSDVNRYEL